MMSVSRVMSWFVINNVVNTNIFGKLVSGSTVNQCRQMSFKVHKLEFSEFGDPGKVLKLTESTCEKPINDQVVIKFLLVPVNPADINTIQGVYPIKPKLPGVPGNEGVAEVVAVGSDVKTLQVGDRVICNSQPASSWRTHALVKDTEILKGGLAGFHSIGEAGVERLRILDFSGSVTGDQLLNINTRVPKDIGLAEVAGISSNPSTAYRMLKDFVKIAPGEPIIQNGGNSAVGQNVIQLAAAWNITSINIVRDRPELPALREYLTSLGANYVLTEEELEKQRDFFEKNSLKKPLLALNCVGGKSALNLIRQLRNDGIMVTYGGMSREPVTIPVSAFIFKNIALRGFWMTAWHKANRHTAVADNMYQDLFDLMRQGKLKAPRHKILPLSQYQEAISNTMNVKGFSGYKYFIDMNT